MDRLSNLHPCLTVLLSQALHNYRLNAFESKYLRIICHLFFAIAIFAFPPYSLVSAAWKITALLLRQLPFMLSLNTITTGPLGKGYAKLCSVAAALFLWTLANRFDLITSGPDHPLSLGSWPPNPKLLIIVVILSTQVNYVLSLWSRLFESKTQSHIGVMQQSSSLPKVKLGWKLQGRLLCMAIINAMCEEGECRGFWRSEYMLAGLSRRDSNVAQAVFFGLWHYNGIPSGAIGMFLTFVYGLLMGYLQDASQGLGLPILAHTIADFYIFAHVSRQAMQKQAEAKRRQETASK
ncbi:hypothetical protein MPSEU_000226500 [Mayamaea pseudoterrestris]|nr:hypothetical protein MPSEU_000226500 [Mayamaea pseudoterrestris]